MKEQPLISISIVSHGDAEKVSLLLASILKCETDTKRVQVILTDNLGNDLPEFDPSLWASLQIVRNTRQQGLASNNNHAFEFANGTYFATLNPDLVFENPVFDALLESLQTHHADVIAPRIIDTNGQPQDSFRPLPSPAELIQRRLPGYRFSPPAPDTNGLIRPDWIAGMFWLMPSTTYRALNGMDEKFKLYFEDVDFCTRARLQNMNLIVDTKHHVLHDAQRASKRSPYYLYLHTKSAFQFFTSPVYKQIKARTKKSDR